MSNNRFFDETKIIKKKEPVTEKLPELVPEAKQQSEPEPEPEESVNPPKEKKPRRRKETMAEEQPVRAQSVSEQQYMNFIQDVIDNEPELVPPTPKRAPIEITVETKPVSKPVYNYTRDETGKLRIEPKGKMSLTEKKQNNNSEKKRRQMIEMLEKTDDELVRLGIELDIFAQLEISAEEPKKTRYENKLRTIQDEIKYNESRKSILEKMLSMMG